MKIASLVFLGMLAVMALLGSVLLDQSAQTARELAQVTQSTNRQLQEQQQQLAQAKTQLQAVTQELTQLKVTQANQVPQTQPKPQPLDLRLDKDKKASLRKEALRTEALLKEDQRLTGLEETLKLEKLRIQKTQQQIDADKQQLDADEKSLDLEMLAAVLENRLQKKLSTMVSATAAPAALVQAQSSLPMKGADLYGELPYRPVPVSVEAVQPVQADNSAAIAQITARKNNVLEDRKKLWARQRALDEDKQKLMQATEQLKHQRLELARAMHTTGVKQP